MHRLLLFSGILLHSILSLIRARPVMLDISKGPGMNLLGNIKLSDNYKNNGVRNSNDVVINHRVNTSQTPEYMLELYEKLSKNSPEMQTSNIVRSFKHLPHLETNTTGKANGFRSYRIHSLIFDISALDVSERTTWAELRLFTLIQRDLKSYMGVNRVVSIYEILDQGDTDQQKYRYITSKYIYGVENSWESFDVTDAVKRSMAHGLRVERFEVRIQTLLIDTGSDDMDINANPNDAKQPILVVYSNDISIEHEHNVETRDMIMHELSSSVTAGQYTSSGAMEDNMYGYNEQNLVHSREKRSRGSICKRRPLYVNFEDIGWHTWIIAPRGFQAYQCAGKCTFPLSEHLSPSKHAMIQAMMHAIHPKRTARSCCVPTKLDPISILYIDQHDVPTYKYRYDGMMVAECGCR